MNGKETGMRANSGGGKSRNNNRDPTLKEHEEAGGHRPVTHPPGEAAEIGGKASGRGEASSAGRPRQS
jgi:hypothetical protein